MMCKLEHIIYIPASTSFWCYGCEQSFSSWMEAETHVIESIPEGCSHLDYTENEMDGTGVCNDCGRQFEVPPGGWINA
jgi:hypothetical protein